MALADLAVTHYRRQVALARQTAESVGRFWARVDRASIGQSWAELLRQVMTVVVDAQTAAAAASGVYVADAAGEQDVDGDPAAELDPSAFAGIASDGRDLESLLYLPAITALSEIGRGTEVDAAMNIGAVELDMIVRTQVADAGRVADGVAITTRPTLVGYTRVLVPPSCSRCIVLAGRWYRWNEGFERHPRCDCRHVPTAEVAEDDVDSDPRATFDAMPEAEQDRVFTKAGAQAIRDGADLSRVVNSRRGMYTAAGRLMTTDATTRRGTGRRARLMPEQIYLEAGDDRDEALRLLYRNGYLLQRPSGTAPKRKAAAVRRRDAAPAAAAPEPDAKPKAKAEEPVQGHVVVKGQDRLAELIAQVEADPATLAQMGARNKAAHFDVALSDIAAKQGFDGLPQVGTSAELDAAVASGWTEIWRGVQGSYMHTAAAINGRLRTGAYEPGKGVFGNGWYTSVRRMTAETYRGREPKTNFPAGGGADFEQSDLEGPQEPDSMVRLALNPQARVIDYAELKSIRDKWLSGQAGKTPELRAYFSDPGRLATALGYDAFRVPGDGGGDGGYYPGWEEADDPGGADQFVVLNRTAVLVQRAEDEP